MNHKSCCIEDCKSSSSREQDRGVTFHRLPKEGPLRDAWISQGHLERLLEGQATSCEDESNANNKPGHSICSRHFRKVDFELKIDTASKFVLKSGAIPTIFPWGITQLQDLPTLYPHVVLGDYRPPLPAKQEVSPRKEAGGGVVGGGAGTQQGEGSKVEEGAMDGDSDKDGAEGNLVIDESTFLQTESANNKKRKRRRNNNKPVIKRKPKRIPRGWLESAIKPKSSDAAPDGIVTQVKRGYKGRTIRQPQARRVRGPRKKNITTVEQLVVPSEPAPSTSVERRSSTDIASHSPMLKALIEKPNVPMVSKPPFNPANMSASPEKKLVGNEKGMMVPGAIVEAKDFSEQWYRAKIVEVDYDEKEVLIHYDNWSQRYDEWISMLSPRLRVVAPPVRCQRVPSTPITYIQGERCLARWSDNRRFPATIQEKLPDDKYKVLFDDGFVRVMKWQHLAKGQPGTLNPSTMFSPMPYGSRKCAPPLPLAPRAPPPPPLHNHLFDPKRDHLGSKEERRDKKRKINVKELFSSFPGKKRRAGQNMEGLLKQKRRGSSKMDKSKPELPKPEEVPTIEPEATTAIAAEEPSRSTIAEVEEKKETVEEEKVKDDVVTTQTKDVETKIPTKVPPSKPIRPLLPEAQRLKKLLGRRSSSPKHHGERIKSPKVRTHSVDGVAKRQRSKTMPPLVPIVTMDVQVKTEQAEEVQQKPTLSKPISATLDEEDLSRLLKDEWSCKWVDNQPVGVVSVMPPLERHTRADGGEGGLNKERLSRITVKVDDYRLPPNWSKFLTRRCVGNSAGKWDVVLMCPQGRRFRSKAEIAQRLSEPDGVALRPYQTCLQDFSVHRKLARRLGWDTMSEGAQVTPPLESKKKSVTPSIKRETPVKTEGTESETPKASKSRTPSEGHVRRKPGPKPKVHLEKKSLTEIQSPFPHIADTLTASPGQLPGTPGDVIETPKVEQPPLEEGYIYVGSLKVQIIDTLLRCPKEGCFKNFRKDNLLQMHIKHYHRDMISLLGDTPNVADLAYARTVVEDVTPVKSEKPHRVREKKTSLPTPVVKVDPDLEIKHEVSSYDIEMDHLQLDMTPKKEMINSEVLEHSPKLRTLLMEPKLESPSKMFMNNDVEDILQAFKIKQENGDTVKVKVEKPFMQKNRIKHSKKPDKELTKSQVISLINKIAEGGDRSRSPSPVNKYQDRCNMFDVCKTEGTSGDYDFQPPSKSKKKRKKYDDNDDDFKPSSSKKKKKKLKSFSYSDIWKAYTAPEDDAMNAVDNSDAIAPSADTSMQSIEGERKQDDQTFINDNGEKIKIVHMKREEIINCYCGYGEEDGLMIQCELCLCWQHAVCHGIERESQVPDKYICHICLYPPRGRKSQRHLNNQDWLYEGRLPRVEHQIITSDPNVLNGVAPLSVVDQNRAQALKKSHQLCGNLLHVSKILYSLRCKIDISQKKDHPKLYLWSKPWDNKIEDSANVVHEVAEQNSDIPLQQQELIASTSVDHHHHDEGVDGMGDEPGYLDKRTEEMIDSNIGPYGDITIDEVKLEENIEVSEIEDGIPKCVGEIELGGHSMEQAGLLSSPGGTPIHLPITNMDLKTLVKSVQVCAPQPEAAIDPMECKQRLLQHIDNLQLLLDARLDSIEAQIAELESQDPSLEDDETPESYPRTKQTMQMLLRDLETLQELGALHNSSICA